MRVAQKRKEKWKMDKKILVSLILIGLLGAAAGIGTWAYFSSTRTMNPGFYTASLNLELGVDYPWETSVLHNMAPGEDRVQIFRLTNTGTTSGSFSELQISYEVMPTIDGVISGGEWNGAASITVVGGKGTVKVLASAGYLYVLFDLVDPNDARTQYVNEVGNDQISININPTDGGPWGFPYDLIFETSALSAGDGGHHQLPWNPKENSGTIDGWATRWFPNNLQEALPVDLESATIYSGGKRITEWKLPLASIGVSPGDVLKVGGAVDVGDGGSYVYPIGLVWSDAGTYMPCILKGDIGEVITVKVDEWLGYWHELSSGYTLKQWVGGKLSPILEEYDGVGAVQITLHFDEDAGNEYQNICGDIDFTFTLWQGP